uniref:Intercellular adhesion molecule 1 n=1 Tax=Oryctolagus cuniculus TaxID=9986 RepID=U3KPG6_RABIT|nr:intercellular adhesion molecule 1 isoform X2 [Oryctolagus cuniculus]
MAPDRVRRALPALLALLAALLPGPGDAQTSVFPSEVTLPRGGSTRVNCSAACAEPSKLGLETQLSKEEVAHGDNWKVFELSDVQEDSTLICFSDCESQSMASARLTVYATPDSVELAPLPPWQPVGEDLTLRCRVVGGQPRAQLSVLLLRGEEELSRQPALGEPAEVTATVQADRSDHGANFSCVTELDLRPLGLELFKNVSAPRQLQTFELPVTGPQLAATPAVVEVGAQCHVSCSLDGLFPAPEAQVQLELGGRKLDATVSHGKDAVSAMASVRGTAEEEGAQQVVCAVLLGNRRVEATAEVTVYSFPAPNLTLSEPEVSEGTEVVVQCEGHDGTRVTLDGTPAWPVSARAQLRLNASAEDNGRRFSCSAALDVAGQVLRKNQTRELRVLYGPRLDERDCLGNWTWQEGSQQTLRCEAWGNPRPELSCRREGTGAPLPIGELRPVQRQFAGTYLCRAVSSRGEVTREVFIHVLPYKHSNVVIIIVVAAVVLLGTWGTAAYVYNRQRKIKKYKLQKAQEAATVKLNTPQASPS